MGVDTATSSSTAAVQQEIQPNCQQRYCILRQNIELYLMWLKNWKDNSYEASHNAGTAAGLVFCHVPEVETCREYLLESIEKMSQITRSHDTFLVNPCTDTTFCQTTNIWRR
jgi:hypothetical protein